MSIFDRFLDLIYEKYVLINEAGRRKPISYIDPPPRAKFKKGDNVVIRDSGGGYDGYHPKYLSPYKNKAGVVVGYLNYPGAYTKFALQFENGDIELIHSQFLYGPFKDFETAKKYEDTNIPFDSSDIIGSLDQAQINTRLEATLKNILTQDPYNFTWLDEPVKDEEMSNHKVTVTILAKRGDCIFSRANSVITKKLTSDNGHNVFKRGYRLILPYDFLSDMFDQYTHDNPLCVGTLRSYINNFTGDIEDLVTRRSVYKKIFKLRELYLNTKLDDNLFYELMGDYITNENGEMVITVPPNKSGHSWKTPYFAYCPDACKNINSFSRLVIKGNTLVSLRPSLDFSVSPKLIKGDLDIRISTANKFDDINFSAAPQVTGRVEFMGADYTDNYNANTTLRRAKELTKDDDSDDISDW